MPSSSRFVYIMDRYLEVSNVYHQRMLHGAGAADSQVPDRVAHLLRLVEAVDLDSGRNHLGEVPTQNIMGQLVVRTPEFLEDTKAKQEYVLARLGTGYSAVSPHNDPKLRKVLGLPPNEFLSSFPAVGYAWDILTELASLLVLPDAEALAARDMIHMHSVELEHHLARVITQERLSSPDAEVELRGSLAVKDLELLQGTGQLVDKLAEFAIPRNPAELLEMLNPLTDKPDAVSKTLLASRAQVLSRLQQETRAFPDTLSEQHTLPQAMTLCDTLVVFGLLAGFAVWHSVALGEARERRALRKSMLFCTRILLDVGRWNVCVEVAQAALAIFENLQQCCGDDPDLRGTSMVRANLLFARKQCGESVDDEVRAWDTSGLHTRYEFLKQILLDNFDTASELLVDLLQVDNETGNPNLCIQEVKEWPILQAFRESEPGRAVVDDLS